MGIAFTLVSRKCGDEAVIGYEEVNEEVMQAHTIIVNCTPLGMHPYEHKMPNIPYALLTENHLLYDCIYNPEKTLFLQMGEKQGCRIKNGLEMLHLQADEAWKIWENYEL
jgi:shikimate dehydrogenase